MASYQEFAKKIGERDVVSAYNDVLIDLNYCINLFEDIETGRTYTETMTDWLAGERAKINIARFPIVLNSLKTEIEHGMELYTVLSFKKQALKLAQTSQGPRLQGISHVDNKTPRWGIEQELMNQFDELLAAVIDIETPEKMQPQNCVYKYIQDMGSYYANSNLSDRAKMYETARVLYFTLNQSEVVKILKDNHATISELINNIDVAVHQANNPGQQENTNVQKTYTKDVVSAQNDSPEETTQKPQLSVENVCSMDDSESIQSVRTSQNLYIANAKDIYYEALSEEQEELTSSEPDMSKETIDTLATRTAVKICKTFLIERFHCSDPEADEIIEEIRSQLLY